jgi:hypothetical protein
MKNFLLNTKTLFTFFYSVVSFHPSRGNPTTARMAISQFQQESSDKCPVPKQKEMRIQYWASKGNARIDFLFDKSDKRIDDLFSKNDARLEHLEKGGKDSDAVRDVRLDHVFSEKRGQRELLFAKDMAQFENTMAEQYSSIEKSMEKIDVIFADGHKKIESVFEGCEKTIELLFAEVENKIEEMINH